MGLHEHINLENTYARELEGFYIPWRGAEAPRPSLVLLNDELALELGFDPVLLRTGEGAAFLSGSKAIEGSTPLAQAYAGHQFGGFSPQLGDGRALLIGEVIDRQGRRRDIHLKGSGRTPFSRGGDGKAVLGPVLREYLIGEAMHALGIPTTRALAVVTTGEEIARETFQPGAVLARVAASHLRVGTFQFFAVRGEREKLVRLVDYAIRRHYPDLADREDRALALLAAVSDRQAALVAKWMAVGFVHGVMNTDNMTISGETIDYGPCAFIDAYDPKAVFSSIDQWGRYAYGNQPVIAQWNLARFAETLLELIDPADGDNAVRLATAEIDRFPQKYQRAWLNEMRRKLGLLTPEEGDLALATDLHAAMAGRNVDFTKLFRALASAARGDAAQAPGLFSDATDYERWLPRWLERLVREPDGAAGAAERMDAANPVYIPRNQKVEAALAAAVAAGDLAPFNTLLALLRAPFTPAPGAEDFAEPPPAGAPRCVTFCGT
jgi:uncharacterized protein YdiU (UPF0061 family)